MVLGEGWDTWSWTREMKEGGIFSLPSLLWRPTPSSLMPGSKSCFGGSSANFEQDLETFKGGWFAWAGGGQRLRTAGALLGVGDAVSGSWAAPEPTGTRLAVTVMEAKPLCCLGHCFGLGESDGDMVVSSKGAWISNRLGSTKNVLPTTDPWWGNDGFVWQALGWGIRACIGTEGCFPLDLSSSICAMITGEIDGVFWEGRGSCKWKDSQLSPHSVIRCATRPPSITADSSVQNLLLTSYS